MNKRKEFATKLAELDLTHVDRAIALLWYYRQTQEFEERSAFELANDLHDAEFPNTEYNKI